MRKKILLIKDGNATVKCHASYMTVRTHEESYVVGYRHIEEMYIHKSIALTPNDCLRIAKACKLYFVDRYGYVLASFRMEDAQA